MPARSTRALVAALVIAGYAAAGVGAALGLWATEWSAVVGGAWEPASAEHWFGTNRIGQDIFQRTLAGAVTAFEVGLTVAVATVLLGGFLGGVAGYYSHTWVDGVLLWLKGTIESIPFYLLVICVAVALRDHGWAMQAAMVVALWPASARIVRAETMRIIRLDYIEAARASGSGAARIIWRHVLPHLSPLLSVQGALVFVAAIKVEVILSFLGVGAGDSISWGLMLAEAGQDVIAGEYANLVAGSVSLAILVLSVNSLSDHWGHRRPGLSGPLKPA